MQEIITRHREQIAELCRQHHVRRLAVFGSAARDDFDPERSDVDFLVEFEPLEYPHSVENYRELKEELKSLFERSVDLVREGSIENPYLSREIDAQKKTLYAA